MSSFFNPALKHDTRAVIGTHSGSDLHRLASHNSVPGSLHTLGDNFILKKSTPKSAEDRIVDTAFEPIFHDEEMDQLEGSLARLDIERPPAYNADHIGSYYLGSGAGAAVQDFNYKIPRVKGTAPAVPPTGSPATGSLQAGPCISVQQSSQQHPLLSDRGLSITDTTFSHLIYTQMASGKPLEVKISSTPLLSFSEFHQFKKPSPPQRFKSSNFKIRQKSNSEKRSQLLEGLRYCAIHSEKISDGDVVRLGLELSTRGYKADQLACYLQVKDVTCVCSSDRCKLRPICSPTCGFAYIQQLFIHYVSVGDFASANLALLGWKYIYLQDKNLDSKRVAIVELLVSFPGVKHIEACLARIQEMGNPTCNSIESAVFERSISAGRGLYNWLYA